MYVCVWCVYARVYACVRVCVCAGVRVNYIYVPLQFVVSFINGVCDMWAGHIICHYCCVCGILVGHVTYECVADQWVLSHVCEACQIAMSGVWYASDVRVVFKQLLGQAQGYEARESMSSTSSLQTSSFLTSSLLTREKTKREEIMYSREKRWCHLIFLYQDASECARAACPEDTVECVPFVWCCITLMCLERTKGQIGMHVCLEHTQIGMHVHAYLENTHTQIVSRAHAHTHAVHADTR